MTAPEPVTDPIAGLVAKIKTEFDLGGYFSDRSHTEKAEQLLDALAAQLRAALTVLQHFADRGTCADLTPTMANWVDAGAMYGEFSAYLQRIDQMIRDSAQAALAAAVQS